MDKTQFDKIIKSLDGIDKKLDVLIILQKQGRPKQKIAKEQKKILALCDRNHTIETMVKETSKTECSVKSILHDLREKGLIRTVEVKNMCVYERI